jgi:hypothetical protein
MLAIGADVLLSLYQSRSATGTAAFAPRKTVPNAPWQQGSTAPQASDLVKAVLAGRKFIQPDAVQLDVKGASEDYRKLFGLYQGINALNALAERADAKGVGSTEKTTLARRFGAGMAEVDAYVDALKLEQLRLVRGEVQTTAKTAVGLKRDKAEYVTGMVHAGAMDAAAPALAGDVRFSLTLKRTNLPDTVIDIDLAAMSGTRSFGNLINHLNDKLTAAGVATRFDRVKLPAETRTVTAGGKTVTLPAGPDRWAMKVVGSESEALTFGTPQSADAVYVAQVAGATDKTKGLTPVNQLLKFQTDVGGTPPAAFQAEGEANWVEGRAFARTLGPELAAVRATATGADGSVWVLGDVTDTTGGQALQGERDVALLKYDSAGKLLFTRTLGAAEEAQGYALAVSADGKVAVAGSVKGALGGVETSLDTKQTDGFVTLYDSEGQELWTRRRGAVLEDEAKAVAFGADGTVFVGGRARSAVPGGTAVGGWDGYLQSFAGADGKALSARQFGTAGTDGVTALAVEGSAVVVAGAETGRGVLRRFEVGAGGVLTAGAVRDLGDLQGGSIAGLAFDGAGGLVAAGATRNAALAAGTVNTAHSGGKDGFVARLSATLGAAATDRLTYVGGAGEEGVTALAVKGGQVYLAGAATGALPGAPTLLGKSDGFLLRMDAATGAVGWSRRFTGKDGEVAPTSIAVAAGGASVLDRLGLPKGTLDYTESDQVTAATAARAGDQFFIRTREGAPAKAVTIEAGDTLKTLAVKINRAMGFVATAEVIRESEFDRIRIKPRSERTLVEISPGKGGKDALASLGLSEGVVRHATFDAKTKADVATEESRKVYGLKLGRDLNLSSAEQVKHAMAELQTAMVAIRKAYSDLRTANTPKSAQPITGEAPKYLQGQLANYHAALQRLGS